MMLGPMSWLQIRVGGVAIVRGLDLGNRIWGIGFGELNLGIWIGESNQGDEIWAEFEGVFEKF